MESMMIGVIAFACAFGGAVAGLLLRMVLPEHHLSKESKEAIAMGAGLIVTLTALVLGLLIDSAKSSFDGMNESLTQSGAKIILLDRTLAHYGPETKPVRDELRNILALGIKQVWSRGRSAGVELKRYEDAPRMEDIQDKLRRLVPQNDVQRSLQAQALQISGEVLQSRWMIIEQMQIPLPVPLLAVLLFWFAVLFMSIGVLAPRNATVVVVLFVCALSVSGAVFLIDEMSKPVTGMVRISSAPLLKALEYLGK